MTSSPATPSQSGVDENLRKALAAHSRPSQPNPLYASRTFVWRAMIGFKHAPEQVGEAIVMPFMFVLMFTYLFGGAIAGSTGEYLHYFLPGILVMTVLIMTVNTGAALNSEIAKGVFDRFRTLPFWQPATIVGALVGDAVRYTFAIVMTIGLGMVLGFRPDGGVGGALLALVILLVFAFSVGWIFTTLGMVVRKPESISNTSMMLLFPLSFISNIFTKPETMPGWLEAVARVNPVSHAATAVRGLLHGTATASQIGLVLLVSALLTAIFAPLTMYLYRRKQ
ncbi:transport permease protein [Longimycelium tulufanense]|uniref:Transport permease protein n=1 Tax=Longimycelium tulufanense TaxID=907463 RepID=A0A8J3CEA6_9PSEU|nr:ABC transporter permease [Longimycelium tulufanense]GGM54618.1 transport permease protein [Longimycelium tulufanense]